jgi:DNA-binding transcriptional ArsR family regulator
VLDAAASGPGSADPQLAAAAKKVAGGLASSERALLSSPAYAQALATRVALECALAEGARLFTSAPAIDGAAVDALAKAAVEAADRVRKEEESAKGATVALLAAAATTLHRDLRSFEDLAARLRSAKAAPRGVGLDPSAAQAAQPAPPPRPEGEPAPRPELKPFLGLDRRAVSGHRFALLGALLALFVVLLVRALFFAGPSIEVLDPAPAGPDVVSVRVSGASAVVVVRKSFLDRRAAAVPPLLLALRAAGVQGAVLSLDTGAPAGQLDVRTGTLFGMASPAPDAGPR